MSVLQKLTEGIVERSLQREGAALLDKWEATGLLEGLDNDQSKQGMARLLENQASQLLKEASSMSGGDVEGFASVAFPIVRRVFGGLLANDLVSVQPMSLPSGLIFFLDFTYQGSRMGLDADIESVYGGGVVASQITGGVSDITEEGGGFYNLSNTYSHATGTLSALTERESVMVAGVDRGTITLTTGSDGLFNDDGAAIASLSDAQKKALRYDVDLLNRSAGRVYCTIVKLTAADAAKVNFDALGGVSLHTGINTGTETVHGLTGVTAYVV